MIVQITKNDIKKGLAKNYFSCPVALAVSRETKKSVGIAWGSKSTPETDDPLWYPMAFILGKWDYISLPVEVMEWINSFDQGKSVEPIGFEMCL